jgi:small subunit ribosomal protein S4
MKKKLSGCRKCRKFGIRLCSKGPKCALDRRADTPGQHGKKTGPKKTSEYGKQLQEKQKVKMLYGVKERQFRRFFGVALHHRGVTGEILLSLLERRLDNVVYRLKMAATRNQARQMVVHGHVSVNGKKVVSPSFVVKEDDIITLVERSLENKAFLENVVDKRMSIGIRVPEWLELQKKERKGVVIRQPIRSDISIPIEEHLIIELYSK